jgi:hypothetical protein
VKNSPRKCKKLEA